MRGWSNVEHDMRYKPSHKVMRAQLQKLRAKRMLVGIDEELHEQLEEDVAHRVAKENRILKSLDEVGSFLQKWLEEHHGAWFQDQTAGSCTSLFNFLETRNMSTRRELRQVLEETFSCNSEAAYSSLASQYPTGSLTLVIFIMDRLLLTDDESDSPDSFTGNDHKTHVWKLRAMMSTIVWLDRLFVPPLKWQQVFAAQNQKFLRGAFFWLNSSRQGFFLEGSLLGQDDIVILDELWSWFEHQTDRQIRLTFAMSKN
ncbi:uncharacterized protein PFLUO_LOCUS416, partial [Penicillium psychrofluorescens]|uniref:uncharacterized protein n=1 Tax=Penicillium psychrofluorescens TaxID=3158075 RepID=UPI003CCD5DFE